VSQGAITDEFILWSVVCEFYFAVDAFRGERLVQYPDHHEIVCLWPLLTKRIAMEVKALVMTHFDNGKRLPFIFVDRIHSILVRHLYCLLVHSYVALVFQETHFEIHVARRDKARSRVARRMG
jgi:hypothetical protein